MNRSIFLLGLLSAVALSPAIVAGEKLPAFPGAEGFGAFTPGGRGGKVLFVTNVNDSGPGSLRAACETKGPRLILFRVSGLIELKSKLVIREPFITIAGQTAPGDGICIKNFNFSISTHDAVVRYLRFRPGDEAKAEIDAVGIKEGENVILDHCSASWSIDEVLSPTKSKNVTVQWCMITESLNNSIHHKGPHGYGSLITGPEGGMSFHHNVYAHHRSRSPRPGAPPDTPGMIFDFRNNVIYDWGDKAGYSSQTPVHMNYVGNYLKPGPSTKASQRSIAFSPGGERTKIHLADNFILGFPEKNRDNSRMLQAGGSFPKDEPVTDCLVDKPFPSPPVITETAGKAYHRILATVGASVPARDAVDARVIEQIKTGRGKIINSQKEVGGWPSYRSKEPPKDADSDGIPDEWETAHGLNPNDPADANRMDGNGYTHLETYLNDLVNAVRFPTRPAIKKLGTIDLNVAWPGSSAKR